MPGRIPTIFLIPARSPAATDNFSGKTVYLGADLNMGGNYNTSSGWSADHMTMPIGGRYYVEGNTSNPKFDTFYKGSFDGQGHDVYNVYMGYNNTTGEMVGLFGRVGAGGVPAQFFRNVWVDGYICGGKWVAGIVGRSEIGAAFALSNCVNSAKITGIGGAGGGVGGVAGAVWGAGTVTNCVNFASVTSPDKSTAGIVAYIEGPSTLTNCYNIGTVLKGTATWADITSIRSNTWTADFANRIKNCYYTNLYGITSYNSALDLTSTINIETDNINNDTDCIYKRSANDMMGTEFADLLNNGVTRTWVYDASVCDYPVPRVFSDDPDHATFTAEVKTQPTKTVYGAGQSFNPAGLAIYATFTDGTHETLTGWTVDKTVLAATDTYVTVSGTYNARPYSVQVPITVSAVSTIAITAMPAKTTYLEGQTFSTAGLAVTVTYQDASTLAITNYTVDKNVLSPSDTVVTVSGTYGEAYSLQVPITVYALDTISITAMPATLSYFAGMTFSTVGLVITAAFTGTADTLTVTGWDSGQNHVGSGRLDGQHQRYLCGQSLQFSEFL